MPHSGEMRDRSALGQCCAISYSWLFIHIRILSTVLFMPSAHSKRDIPIIQRMLGRPGSLVSIGVGHPTIKATCLERVQALRFMLLQ
jgi:hypothetical protein